MTAHTNAMEKVSTTQWLESIKDRAAQASETGLHWVHNAIERRLHGENFVVAGQTPFETVFSDGLMSVRYYMPLTEAEITVGRDTLAVSPTQHRIPVVLVPPLAATSLNFDLLPERSLVKFLLAHGHRVYLVDWGDPQAEHHHLGLQHYTTRMLPEALKVIRAHSAEPELSLLGYCMGGLFSLIYAAWSHDAQIRNIITVAAPIDSHQIGVAGKLVQMMDAPLRTLQRAVPGINRFHGLPLDARWLQIPGWANSWMFKLTNPVGVVQGYLDLLMNLWDRDYVTHYQTMSRWFNQMSAYPGGIVQDFVLKVGLGNQLAKGKINITRDEKALLDCIECSLLAIAGDNDKIVSVDAARKVLDIVGSCDKTFKVAAGGHAGVFGGSRAPQTTWTYAAEWLAGRSD
ncbi:alpha/beta fold hydrolase [Sinimarinibacterium sp. NLF-5-8]|uniref:alpha/beta fold hydrolase n=1 Tax=Sinimarinibacterium sp. NLF-5-8 TaxID=2698684 RepID=UPI00192EAACF|nr:alpha/beta fold hydrolase [Sinimarinibacterium sp. NLF-5-8]